MSRLPLSAFSTVGAEIWVTLNTIALFASLLNTAIIVSSMPAKLPWIIKCRHRHSYFKICLWLNSSLVKMAISRHDVWIGWRYDHAVSQNGCRWVTKVCQTPAFSKAVAIVVRSVVIAAVILSPPLMLAINKGLTNHVFCRSLCYPCGKGLAPYQRLRRRSG
jgi:hypothetical protein